MQLNESLKAKLLDVRLRDKLIFEGKITKEQVKEYLASLPDEAERQELFNVDSRRGASSNKGN